MFFLRSFCRLVSLLSGLLVIGLGCVAMVSVAQGDQAVQSQQTAAQVLIQQLRSLEQYQAEFSQITYAASGQVLQRQQGRLYAARPEQFHWAIQDPLQPQAWQQVIISNGTQVWMIDHDLEQVTLQPLDARVANTPALLFSGDLADIQNHFAITWLRAAAPAMQSFQLLPKASQAESALFQALNLSFADGHLIEMMLVDHLEQQTFLSFTQGQINPQLAPEVFAPQIPEEYDVIEHSGP